MKKAINKIVIIDDAPEYLDFIQRLLRPVLARHNLTIIPFTSAAPALAFIQSSSDEISVIVTDYKMPEMDGIELINSIESIDMDYQVIILSGNIDLKLSQSALHINIFDFLEKLTPPSEIAETVEKAYLFFLEKEKRRASLKNLVKKFSYAEKSQQRKTFSQKYSLFNNMLGSGESFIKFSTRIKTAAKSKAACLILGETGTGKELVARALHNESPRKSMPFTAVNCGAIPRDIFESELFGHKKGSFTNATYDRTGLIEQASGGTLFLDEITEMPIDLQVKILRFLQESSIQRVGENITRKVDVRVIAASNREIETAIKDKVLRADLYYRINVILLRTKPLRDRKSEIKAFTEHFIDIFSDLENKKISGYLPEVLSAFNSYYWPGNIRELRNVVHRMVLFAESDLITLADMPHEILSSATRHDSVEESKRAGCLKEQERETITRAVKGEKTNMHFVARQLGISRATLYRRLKEYQAS